VNSPTPQTTQEARSAREASPTRELRALPELPVRNETDIIREARMLARAGGGEARIQLHPPQLGELSLRVTVTERAVTVSIVAEHAQIADLMARHLPELRQALQATGLRFDNLELDARSAADNLDTFGQAADGEPRGYGAERQGGLLASRFPESQSPLPSVPVNSLGTVDVTI
jgi:flagellar hook-length control protein FliK